MVNWKTVAVPDQTVLIPSDNSYGCNAFKRLSAHCTLLNFFLTDYALLLMNALNTVIAKCNSVSTVQILSTLIVLSGTIRIKLLQTTKYININRNQQ